MVSAKFSMGLLALAAVASVAAFAWIVVASDGEDVDADEIVGGGLSPPRYLEELPLTTGDYLPADYDADDIWQRGLEAAEKDAEKPQFDGVVNGFRVYSRERVLQDLSVEKSRCRVSEFVESSQIVISYVPPGSFAKSPVFRGVCPDGSTAFVMQSFGTWHGAFDVIYSPGERAFEATASKNRVRPLGDADVVIEPLTEEGFGRSWVARATNAGFLLVDADGLPLDESLKILDGTSCDAC